MNVVYALLSSEVDGLVNRAEVREGLDRSLAEIPDRFHPDRETWGMSEEARAGLAAAEALAGPPRGVAG